MSKRLGIIIGVFLVVSVFLLGASFAKESGNDIKDETIRSGSDNVRIVYSNNVINKDNKSVDISIINRSDVVKDYIITIDGISDYSLIKYKIDNSEEKELSKEILYGTLSKYGDDGDYKGHNIEFVFDEDIEFSVAVKEYNGEVVYGS